MTGATRVAGAALLVSLVVALWRAFMGDPLTNAAERRLLDLRFLARGGWETPPTGVAIVALDEAATDAFGDPASMRAALATAAPAILAQEPRAVAIDLIFDGMTRADAGLAAALASDQRVVVALSALNQPRPPPPPETLMAIARSEIPIVVGRSAAAPPEGLLAPTARIAAAARLGHVNLLRDPDGVARAAPMALSLATEEPTPHILPALPLAAVAIAAGERIRLLHGERAEIGGLSVPLDVADRIVIDHVGAAGAVPTLSLLDVLAGDIPEDAFAGRIVFVGATAESRRDLFATPLAPALSGVELLAGIAAAIGEERFIRRDAAAALASVALATALCLLCLLAARLNRDLYWRGGLAAVWAAGLGAIQAAFAGPGLWLDGTAALAALAVGSAAGGLGRHMRLSRERANLARYVAPALAAHLARDGRPIFDRRAQEASVLFIDVVGYTGIAETASQADLPDFLAALHGFFETVSARHRGLIVDFLGDGAMIVFGLPESGADDALRALACAEALVDEIRAFEPPGALADGPPLRLRASVHHGPVVAAVVGGARQAAVTLAGDTVNLASRLQETAKETGHGVVTSRETLEAAGARSGYDRLGVRAVRGRVAGIEVWGRA